MPKPTPTGGMPAMTQETARVHSPITTQRVRINPNDAIAYYNRGVTREQGGDKAGAMQDFQKAADLFQQQGNKDNYQKAINNVRKLQ